MDSKGLADSRTGVAPCVALIDTSYNISIRLLHCGQLLGFLQCPNSQSQVASNGTQGDADCFCSFE